MKRVKDTIGIIGLVVFFVVFAFLLLQSDKQIEKEQAIKYNDSLNKTAYLIKNYGNGIYVIEERPEQYYYYEMADALALGLSEMSSKCNITSKDVLMGSGGAYGILITTSGICEITTASYQRLR